MEIQRALRGETIDFATSRTVKKAEPKTTGTARPAADRLELTRNLVQTMEEQRIRLEALLNQPADREKKSNGILDMLDGAEAESEELDALSKQMKVQQKCLKIAMNIMRGKKVPPEDEKYLMENDPNGYKLAIAMRSMEKRMTRSAKASWTTRTKRAVKPPNPAKPPQWKLLPAKAERRLNKEQMPDRSAVCQAFFISLCGPPGRGPGWRRRHTPGGCPPGCRRPGG